MELMLGLSMHAFPGAFSAPVYAPLRPYLQPVSVVFLLGGIVLVDPGLLRGHRWLRAAGTTVAALPFLLLAAVSLQGGLWAGVVQHGFLGAALLLEPLLASDDPSQPGADCASLVIGSITAFLSALFLISPVTNSGILSLPVVGSAPVAGTVGLVSSLLLAFTAFGAPMGTGFRLASRLAAAAFPALLAYMAARNGIWTGFVGWGTWTVVALFAWEPPLMMKTDETADSLTRLVGQLERWPPLLAAAIAGLSAAAGAGALISPVLVSAGVVLLTGYSATARHTFPHLGTPEQRAVTHMAVFTVILGLLISGVGPLGYSLQALLVIIPLLAARYLGSRAARRLLGLVVAVVIATEVAKGKLEWSLPSLALGRALIVIGTVFAAANIGMSTANKQRNLIEQLRETEGALRASEARFAGVLAIAGDAIISVDDGQRIVLFNRAAEAMFGCTLADVAGQPLSVLIPPAPGSDRGLCFVNAGRVLKDLELTGRRVSGETFPAEASVSTLQIGGESLCTVILRDVTERHRSDELLRQHLSELESKRRRLEILTEELEQASRTDPLTDLANRRSVAARLGEELARSARTERPFSVLLLDVDHFKLINDAHGHHAGDQVLQQVAGLLKGNLRVVDLVGRWGGEEFLILLPESDADAAFQVAERLRQLIAEHPFYLDGRPLTITSTFGGATAAPGLSQEGLVRRADAALYEGKRAGRNCVRWHR